MTPDDRRRYVETKAAAVWGSLSSLDDVLAVEMSPVVGFEPDSTRLRSA